MAAVQAMPATAAPASIRLEPTVCDCGTLLQGEQATCLFTITNSGGEDLQIFAIEPACGCTTALLTAPLVPPGMQGGIRVVFDSSNAAGEVRKEITVNSSATAQSAIILAIRARVETEVDFEPPQVTFDGVRPGTTQRETVVLINNRSEPIEIRTLDVRPSSFHCRLPAWSDPARPLIVESRDRVTIDVGLTPPTTLTMPLAGECLLTIQGPRKRLFNLKLLGLPASP